MEILATREIIKGDEIFIDSGKNWEQAWDQHLRNWHPQRMGKGEWKSANVLNNELGPLEVAPDLSENHISTDSCGVLFTGCLYERESYDDWDGCADADIEWEHWAINDVITEFGTPAQNDYGIEEAISYADGSF